MTFLERFHEFGVGRDEVLDGPVARRWIGGECDGLRWPQRDGLKWLPVASVVVCVDLL
jgi:hypothetical protein